MAVDLFLALSRVVYTPFLQMAIGEASWHDLPSVHKKTFVHISLRYLTKAKCYKINKCFHKEKQSIKFVTSLLANAGNIEDTFELCESFVPNSAL